MENESHFCLCPCPGVGNPLPRGRCAEGICERGAQAFCFEIRHQQILEWGGGGMARRHVLKIQTFLTPALFAQDSLRSLHEGLIRVLRLRNPGEERTWIL